jgi:hypothetical protein
MTCLALAMSTPALASGTIDDFEPYSLGTFPSPNWTVVDPVTAGSPTVQSNGSNVSGRHLQFVSTYSPDGYDTIGMSLPNALTSDGDYVQLATNVVSGNVMASLHMQPGAFLPGMSRPWASVGFDTHFNQFNHGYSTVYESDKRFGAASSDEWYYLRATMRDAGGQAGAIDSYDFQVFSDPAGNNLVAQKLGIEFRNGYEGFISHVALRTYEQANQTATVLFDQITTNKTSSTPPPARPIDFGNQWVRDNPFTIFGRGADDPGNPNIQNFGLSAIEAKNASTTQAAIEQGLSWIAHPSEFVYANAGTYGPLPLTDELKTRIGDYVVQGGMKGILQLDDEPAVEVMDDLGVIADWVRATYPDLMIFVTAGWGPTAQYIDTLMTQVQPDALMYDIYPILHNQAFDLDYHFENLALIRAKGQQYNVPTIAWLQAFNDSVRRTPSESELRLLAYSYLASGYKGLGYFRYRSNGDLNGLLDANGQPVPLHAVAADLNEEIAHLGNSLRFLESTDICYVAGPVSNPPDGLSPWSFAADGDPHLQSMRIQTSVPGRDGMIGHFTDDDGDVYFMLVNMFQGQNLTAAQTAMEFVLNFDSSVDALYRLNRETGVPERIVLFDHVLSHLLPGGTGDLFKYDDGYFPGIVPGDSDLDGDVDLSDLGALATSYGLANGGLWTTGDFDLDGDVDLADLSVLAANYGAGLAEAYAAFQTLAVPEPSALCALLIPFTFVYRRT